MKQVDTAKLDSLQFDLECAVRIVGAIHSAMVAGDFEASEYCDPLYGAYNYLWVLLKELKSLYCDKED